MKTYGRLVFDAGTRHWVLSDLSPHVAIAFKRLFPRVPKTATVIQLSDGDETRADLHWFMQRYPLAHSEDKALRAGKRAVAFRIADRDRILTPRWRPAGITGFKDGLAPYTYQSAAAAIALRNPSLLLGDDAGLGKTISYFATLTAGAPFPAALTCEPHLAWQWHARCEEFTTLRCHVIRGTQPYDLPPADLYVFRYSNIAGWTDIIGKGVFRTAGYDEIQKLRNGRATAMGMAASTMSANADIRMGLTATPIYNYGDEIHAVMSFIKPDLLGDRDEFIREWCGMGRIVRDPDALGSYLRETGYFLRRTEDDASVDCSLPPPNTLEWEVDSDGAAADDEVALTKMLAMTVLNGSFVEAGRAARELDARLRLITGVAKARAVASYVKLLLMDCERVLLGGWHREVYGIWLRELEAFNPVLHTGTESAAGKRRSIEAFCGGGSRVMFISLRSGAGLDGLQHWCNDVVHGELDWSPQVHYQLMRRLRRPGQRNQVNSHFLHTNFGSDPVLLETLGIKTDQSRGINDPGRSLAPRYSDDIRIKRLAEHVLGMDALSESAA